YPLVDATGLYVFLTLAQSALLVGYLTVRWQPPAGRVVPGPALFMPSLVVTLLLLIPTALLNTGQAVPDVLRGIVDPGGAYARSLELRQTRSAFTIVAYVRIFAGPLLSMLLPLLVVFWRDLNFPARVGGVI